MKKIELKFIDGFCSNRLYKRAVAKGVISFGSCTEHFSASLSTWTKQQYRLHWLISLSRVLQKKPSALVCDWQPLVNHKHYSRTCVLFKFYPLPTGVVAVQMQYVWQNKYPLNKLGLPYCKSISPGVYQKHNKFGIKYMEWRFPLEQVHKLIESVVCNMK